MHLMTNFKMNASQGSSPAYSSGLITSYNASHYYYSGDYNTFDTSLYLSNLDVDLYLDLSPLNVALIVLYGFIFLSGLFGNIIVIISIIRFKSLRTLTNYFLLNLTIGDILVIIVCIPLTLGSTIYKKWVYGEVLCKLFPFLQGTAVSVSVLSLLFITGSRYVAIYRPLVSKLVFSKRNVRIMIFFIWCVSFSAMLPLLVVNKVRHEIELEIFESIICEEKWNRLDDKFIFTVFIFIILFVCPFILMTICYIVIGYTLWYSRKCLVDESSCQKNKNQIILRQRRRTVKMLVCILVTFGICWLPYYAVNFWIDANIGDASKTEMMSAVYTYMFPLVVLLGLSNSAVNPVFYYILCRGFRRSFNTILCSGLLKRGEQLLRQSMKGKHTISESVDTAQL
ncbi:QRFP-like peptide receptor isoform X1 [Mya arenaria]|uniref:QRFP-like peptide receptor isoform X1 n=1 Tax=Mya arenaria TaxID=6604 RepID=UPI0022E6DC29|nr:QRFP-like peptide receptor isoform X1 [Mya arenaria]